MSTTILAVIVNLLATLLPLINIDLGTAELTNAGQVIVAIVTGVWIWVQRTTLQKAPNGEGDVNLGGIKK